ncbi:hypothetical protein E4U42_006697 [Claviceps africana]|uniref:SH3 domain-containing protein n=1 Tax=Claviceps africana TaxID=83212 RepID=A0A8K0NEW2_9HYPO|nr:hypothetical protein E4U42_006697 [Claviceps africana]
MSASFRVKALYEYTSPHEDDLNFDVGQIITITEAEDDDWYTGEYTDDHGVKKEGLFPRNFVERFEPTAPPRPTRSRPKKELEAAQPDDAAAATAPLSQASFAEKPPTSHEPEPEPQLEPESEPEPEPEPEHEQEPQETRDTGHEEAERAVLVAPVPLPAPATSRAIAEPASPKSPSAATSFPAVGKTAEASSPKLRPGPPPVSEKPSSFKDRIAAFNKAAAPPIAPFAPGGLGGAARGSNFVKKPFVAPPPSRNAYIPATREMPVTNLYRRDEDLEIKEREAQNMDQAERAGLKPAEQQGQRGADDDQPKPTSLKERIALLQKQQMEQAQRHAEAAAKKEKPKKPQKKKPEATATIEQETGVGEGPSLPVLERTTTAETDPRTSTDDAHMRAPPPPRRRASKGPAEEEVHDGNEADMSGAGDTTEGLDDTTEREDSEDVSRHAHRVPTTSTAATNEDRNEDEEEEEGDQDVEEQDEMDPEVRRKEELRARMAKMSGGMGFHGMFGAPVPPMSAKAPPKKRMAKSVDASSMAEHEAEAQVSRAPPPPIPTAMALPGMGKPFASDQSHQGTEREGNDDGGDDNEDDGSAHHGHEATPVPFRDAPPPVPPHAPAGTYDAGEDEDQGATTTPAAVAEVAPTRRNVSGPGPIPGDRAVPPVPAESRAPPPPPPADVAAPSDGSVSDDELSVGTKDKDLDSPQADTHSVRSPTMPPPRPAPILPLRSPPLSPRPDDFSPVSPTGAASKRSSRLPPPIPGFAPALPRDSSRPPPPPPPGDVGRSRIADAAAAAASTRPVQAGEEDDEEITEYEGDYDTDIGSSVPHKDALKAHARDSSLEESTLQSPAREAPPSVPPPLPATAAPRAVPPPIPNQSSPESRRRSVDVPRAAPPPPPPLPPLPPPPPASQKVKDSSAPAAPVATGGGATLDAEDYDPYHHASPASPLASGHRQRTAQIEEEQDCFAAGPAAAVSGAPGAPAPEQRRLAPPSAPPARSGARQSLDRPRTSTSNRRSVDMLRPPSLESDFIANDVDLGVQSGWWRQANQVPPVFQGRKDIYYESEETTTTNQGSKTVVTRDVLVLFQDYSQTIITARFNPYDASDVELGQRHEGPPRALRQDQMEEFYERFGRQISQAAASRKDTVVGDGTPQGFVMELLRPLSAALPPVGTRSYGALVYANMANASTQQQDVMRAGDIISFRNAKFQGKHGPMHAKYSAEVGRPDHVGVVAEWDGTKKKVRAWEQGRENRKVKLESYKLDDLRSGEVKIWRVVPRTWVGWNSQR